MKTLSALIIGVLATSAVSATELSPTEAARARQVAELLDVSSIVEQLRAPPPVDPNDALQRIQLRVDALADLQRLSMMVDGALAQLQREQFEAASARDVLNSRQSDAVLRWSIAAVLVGSATTVVGTSLQFGNQTEEHLGDGIIVGGAALGAALSIVALVRKNRGRPTYEIETNLLAWLFGRAPAPNSELPRPLLRYLDTQLVGEPASFRRELVDRFVRDGSVSLQPSPSAVAKIDLLTRPIRRSEIVPAAALDLRAKMLDDLRSRVAAMKIDLDVLIREVRAHR